MAALLDQINLCVGCQPNPTPRRIPSKPGNRNEFAAVSRHNERMSRQIDVDSWKPKVERFVTARLIRIRERIITECDPGSEFTARWFQVELAPAHRAVRICSRVIRAGNANRVRHR